MCLYCAAGSELLDRLWEDESFRQYFHERGYDLRALGKLLHKVFTPAYMRFKETLDPRALAMLEAQVTDDIMMPLLDKKGFLELWQSWSEDEREAFAAEQREVHLVRLLLQVYEDELRRVYIGAFEKYLTEQQEGERKEE